MQPAQHIKDFPVLSCGLHRVQDVFLQKSLNPAVQVHFWQKNEEI